METHSGKQLYYLINSPISKGMSLWGYKMMFFQWWEVELRLSRCFREVPTTWVPFVLLPHYFTLTILLCENWINSDRRLKFFYSYSSRRSGSVSTTYVPRIRVPFRTKPVVLLWQRKQTIIGHCAISLLIGQLFALCILTSCHSRPRLARAAPLYFLLICNGDVLWRALFRKNHFSTL